MNIIEKIKNKENISQIAQTVINNPKNIEILIHTIKTDKSAIKYGCEKVLRAISESKPELIYPHFGFFAEQLANDNNFLKWGSIITIANLTAIDKDKMLIDIFDKYYSFVAGPEMIPANNVIQNSLKIIKNLPELKDKIINRLLQTQHTSFYYKGEISPECKNIVCGSVAMLLIDIYNSSDKKHEMYDYIQSQINSTRPKVKKAVQKFMQANSSLAY